MNRMGELKEDLIVLMYASNNCYFEIVPYHDGIKNLSVDFIKGTWSYREWENNQIGKARDFFYKNGIGRFNEGIIGVYNKTKIEHLNSMVFDIIEARRDPNECSDFD